jgi:Bacterial protein of unknown function (DUF899)
LKPRPDRVFLTYSTTGRGTEPASGSFALLDLTLYGRREAWQDNPAGRPEGRDACWYWRLDAEGNATWGPTGRPTRPSAGTATTSDPPVGTVVSQILRILRKRLTAWVTRCGASTVNWCARATARTAQAMPTWPAPLVEPNSQRFGVSLERLMVLA